MFKKNQDLKAITICKISSIKATLIKSESLTKINFKLSLKSLSRFEFCYLALKKCILKKHFIKKECFI